MLKGLDVYNLDVEVKWDQVAEADNAFAFVRGAYGDTPDPSAGIHAAGARAAGLKVGIYHFFRARMDSDKQLGALLRALDAVNAGPGDLPPAIDIEDNPYFDGAWQPADNPAYLAAVRHWIDVVTARVGRAPVIYTRASFWDALTGTKGLNTCPLWVASYREIAPKLPADWSDFTFWQYSESGSVPGIGRPVDMSYFNGDATALKNFLL